MTWRFLILFIFMLNITGQEPQRFTIGEDLEVEIIKPDVYRIIHSFPFGCNSLLVKTGEGEFVLCDTPFHNKAAEILHGWIKKEFGEINLRVINTHFHGDCLGGNYYLNEAGIETYGSDLLVELLRDRGEMVRERSLLAYKENPDQKYYNIHKENKNVPPTRIFKIDEEQNWDYAEEVVSIYYPGEAHAPDNVVVYFEEAKVLFGGCMVFSLSRKSRGQASDGNFEEWSNSVKKVMNKFPETEIVIPGHGGWGDNELLTHTYELFLN